MLRLGLPQIPDQVVSTYELPVEEIVSTGPDRIIVFEGSEEKLVQLSVGLLERLGLGSAPWDRGLSDGYVMPVSASNQLPSGIKNEGRMDSSQGRARVEDRWRERSTATARAAKRIPQRAPKRAPKRSQKRSEKRAASPRRTADSK